ncbi:MAG: discoidin domain-containing protein, partial [Rikenellaceae bacterium]|nr:discoidin domain-containing protein [Rikenellaceae bacterium]
AFCRWVLPYREANEKLEDWRNDALSFHRPDEDSLKAAGDMWELGRLLINTSGVNFSGDVHLPFDLSFRQMDMIKEGHCGAMSDYTTMLLRSRGIPASTESTPAWGNRSSGHAWNAIIAPDGTTVPIGFYGDNTVRIFDDHRLSKVYRHCYGMATETLPFKYGDSESIPPYFSGMDMIDVTGEYDMPTVDIAIDNLDASISKLVWLCTFNNARWVPVACAEIADGRAIFRDMGNGQGFNHDAFRFEGGDLGIVYLPAYYKNGAIIPASAPVLAKEDGSVSALVADTDDLQSVTVKRKYPLFRSFCNDTANMTGTRFEASDSADFADAVTLLTIDSPQPHPLTPHKTDHADKKFRYVRYRFPDMHLPDTAYSVCELCFYSGDERLVGKTVYGADSGSVENPENLFDGKMLTYCKAEKPRGAWVGLELETPRNITSIEYMPRTDDNDIWPGDVYEMLYWDNGWQSAGQKTATEYELTWDDLPSGTLYLVIDRTKGVENRIFTYDNRTVRWW